MYNLILCPKGYNMHSPGYKPGVNVVTVFNPDGVAQKFDIKDSIIQTIIKKM